MSFGYSRDIQTIVKALPTICQGFLLSATLSEELDQLKKIVLHSPAILKLEEEDELQLQNGKAVGSLMQFYLRLPKKDKFLVIYVFLKLGLLQGKGLFFVNSTDGGYRLKLFLEQFHIRSAVLNAELPARSRMSILDQFNAGNFDYLIATDESSYTTSHSKKHRKSQQEYGVSRGLDFRNVSFVLNVDMPASPESYTHRIGRTARGGAKGVALTLVTDESILTTKSGSLKTLGETKKQQAVVVKSTLQEDAVEEEGKLTDLELLEQIQGSQPPLTLYTSSAIQSNEEHSHLQTEAEPQQQEQQQQMQPCPLEFELKELEGFRYRVEDVSRAVTKTAVQETRAAELKAELLNSERLSAHFEINPTDLQILRHDRTATHVSMVQDHLKNVPSYMLPKGMQVAKMKKKRKRRNYNSNHNRRAMSASKSNDPLHSYDTSNNNTSNTSTTTTATTTSENDGYFGENPNTEEVPKKTNKRNEGTNVLVQK